MKRRLLKISGLFAFCVGLLGADLHFVAEPADVTRLAEENIRLTGSAEATLPVAYQWFKGTFPVPGATAAELMFQAFGPGDGGAFRLRAQTSQETNFSRTAQVIVLARPILTIATPAAGSVLTAGAPQRIAVTVDPGATITNVLFLNGASVLGSRNEPPFEINPVLSAGEYVVRTIARASWGAADTSGPVSFRVEEALPKLTVQPISQKVLLGRTVDFHSDASGVGPLTYKWYFNDAEILGATQPNLTNVTQAGVYKVAVSNGAGRVESVPARLEIATQSPELLQRFWRPVPTFPTSEYHGMAFGNGTLVVVGEAGSVVVSKDGQTWLDVSPPFTNALKKVRFLEGSFWAVGDKILLRSEDGLNWRSVETGLTTLRDIASKAGMLMAGGGGEVARSENGTNWSRFPIRGVFSITAGNEVFVANSLGSNRAQYVSVSSDGRYWETITLTEPYPEYNPSEVVFFKGQFFLIQNNGIYASADGRTWIRRVPILGQGFDQDQYYQGIITSNSRILFMGGSPPQPIIRSDDGTNFVTETVTERAIASAYTGEAFFSVSSAGIKGSLNGVAWTSIGAGVYRFDSPKVQFTQGRFYVTGLGAPLPSSGWVEVSDGSDRWTERLEFALPVVGVAFGNDRFVAGTALDDAVYTSTDGVTFARVTATGFKAPSAITFREGEFLSVAKSVRTISRSEDGTNWQGSGSAVTDMLAGITKANETAVAVGVLGSIYLSTNRGPWQKVASGTTALLRFVEFANGLFVAGGEGGNLLYSADGAKWFKGKFPSTTTINNLAYAEGMFLAATDTGLAWSWDGVTWEFGAIHTLNALTGVAYGNGRWVIKGSSPILMQTGPQPGFNSPNLSAVLDGNTIRLEIEGAFTQRIRLESATNLSSPSWTLLEPIVSDGTHVTQRFFDVDPGSSRFFRVVSE